MIDSGCAGAAGDGRAVGGVTTGNQMWVATTPVGRHLTVCA